MCERGHQVHDEILLYFKSYYMWPLGVKKILNKKASLITSGLAGSSFRGFDHDQLLLGNWKLETVFCLTSQLHVCDFVPDEG